MKAFVKEECPSFWDAFAIEHSPLLFHRSIWAKVLREGYGQKPLFCWLEQDGRPVLGMLGGIADYKIVRLLFATLHYGGLVGDVAASSDFFRLVIPGLKKRGIHQIRLVETACRPELENFGWQCVEVPRHIVDLRTHTVESLFHALKRSVRKNVRKSKKLGVTVEAVTDRSAIDDVFQLYLKTMAHNKAAAKYPVGRFLGIYDHLVPLGLGIILVARHEGRVIGSNTLVCSEDMVHDIQLSYDHTYQHLRPNDALVFASMEWTIKKGLYLFDFMGSPSGDTSLEQFKAKWLAERTTTATYNKNLDPVRCLCWRGVNALVSHPLGAWLSRAIRKD